MDSLPETVTCPKCGIEKPLHEFYKNKTYSSGYATNSCKKCHVKISVEKAKDSKKTKDYKRAWHMANRERLSEKSRSYREANKDELARKKSEYNSLNKDKSKARIERWKERNPDGVNQISRRRRARKMSVQSENYSEQDIINRWGIDCHICNEAINLEAPRRVGTPGWERGLHLDHVIPIVAGGADIVENVKPAHGLCNLKKHKSV